MTRSFSPARMLAVLAAVAFSFSLLAPIDAGAQQTGRKPPPTPPTPPRTTKPAPVTPPTAPRPSQGIYPPMMPPPATYFPALPGQAILGDLPTGAMYLQPPALGSLFEPGIAPLPMLEPLFIDPIPLAQLAPLQGTFMEDALYAQGQARAAELDAVHLLRSNVYGVAQSLDSYGRSVDSYAHVLDSYGRSLDAIRETDYSHSDMRRLQFDMQRVMAEMDRAFGRGSFRTQAPPSWDSQDPADSLYRRAQRALTSESYQQAVELFRRIRTEYPRSTYTPDAPYWEAFALQRIGGESELRAALAALSLQQKEYPKAATRSDASTLNMRIEGMLARNGDQALQTALLGTASKAADGCGNPQDDERIDALNAVTQMDAEKALPILRKVLARREPCTQALRRTAVWLVGSRKTPEAADMLISVAKADPDKDVREQAIFWLANVPTDAAANLLAEIARSDADLDLRKRAVYSLSRSTSPKATATLRDIAFDASTSDELRLEAVQWYVTARARAKEDVTPFLREVYTKSKDARFRQRILPLIARQNSEATRDFMMAIAMDNSESINTRSTAVAYMRYAGATAAQIANVYDRSTEADIKRQVMAALISLPENGGVEKLVEIGRNEKNAELRKQAVLYLSRTKDPRALQLMQEIIDR